jgi:hypothetical protein
MADESWNTLDHEKKMQIFKEKNDDEIIAAYQPSDVSDDDFRRQLAADRRFWNPSNISKLTIKGGPPTKETTIGAWRDLSRAEALLELIDNSVDVWMRRRSKYPSDTAKKLQIYIDVDGDIFTYEDNAGGVEVEKLKNLIVPGFSDTTYEEHTIGSYKTGGKKAIFKLASEANIRTRFWNPVGTSDEAFEIHLDKNWLSNAELYDFPVGYLKDKTVLQKGQTIYMFRLPQSLSEWNPLVTDQVTAEIRRNYTLLMLRNPEIKIYFMDRNNPLTPLQDLYKFTGVYDKKEKLDLRPQRVHFHCQVYQDGIDHDVTIEVVLGCRTTTAEKQGEDVWGIDLYGNNRLFVYREYDLFLDWYKLPKGGARHFMRGYINIIGPNMLIPWDTHKRHLNSELPVVQYMKNDKWIREFFQSWASAYNNLSSAEDIKKIISKKTLKSWRTDKDLKVQFTSDVKLTGKRRNLDLPTSIHKPTVPTRKPALKPIELKLKFTKPEFMKLCEKFDIDGSPEDRNSRELLSQKVQDKLLS